MQELSGRKRTVVIAQAYEVESKGSLSPTQVHALNGFSVARCDHGLDHFVGTATDQEGLRQLLRLGG